MAATDGKPDHQPAECQAPAGYFTPLGIANCAIRGVFWFGCKRRRKARPWFARGRDAGRDLESSFLMEAFRLYYNCVRKKDLPLLLP
jgi:hypothetical protein